MEQRLHISLGERSYPIVVGDALLDRAAGYISSVARSRTILVVTNGTVGPLYLERLVTPLRGAGFTVQSCIIPDGEEFKTLKTMEQVLDAALAVPLDRNALFVALGGGVVGDITGFAAATYLRGVDFVQIPTTLLSQVDSSVGGKTGVNHPRGKNMIGAFHQPRLVLADVSTFSTLPERDFRSGIAEVVKYGAVLDADFFRFLEENRAPLLQRDPSVLCEVVLRCCAIKASVVEADEREGGLRAVLNFGHTVGHALETMMGYGTITHGEGVSIGMVQAARLSLFLGGGTPDDLHRLVSLLSSFNLPVEMPIYDRKHLSEALLRDKKAREKGIQFVLLKGIGGHSFHRFPSVDDLLDLMESPVV